MVKALKEFVPAICREQYGHLVLLRIFDVVDDTVLVGKSIIAVRVAAGSARGAGVRHGAHAPSARRRARAPHRKWPRT